MILLDHPENSSNPIAPRLNTDVIDKFYDDLVLFEVLNSRRHHARTDIAMRDELSDMDYPIWIIRRIRNEEGGW